MPERWPHESASRLCRAHADRAHPLDLVGLRPGARGDVTSTRHAAAGGGGAAGPRTRAAAAGAVGHESGCPSPETCGVLLGRRRLGRTISTAERRRRHVGGRSPAGCALGCGVSRRPPIDRGSLALAGLVDADLGSASRLRPAPRPQPATADHIVDSGEALSPHLAGCGRGSSTGAVHQRRSSGRRGLCGAQGVTPDMRPRRVPGRRSRHLREGRSGPRSRQRNRAEGDRRDVCAARGVTFALSARLECSTPGGSACGPRRSGSSHPHGTDSATCRETAAARR